MGGARKSTKKVRKKEKGGKGKGNVAQAGRPGGLLEGEPFTPSTRKPSRPKKKTS